MDFFKRTFGLGEQQPQTTTTDQKTEPAPSNEPAVDHNTPQQSSQGIGSVLKSLLSGKLGSDVMSAVSLPAWLYEPLTILQRSCETLAHSHLLDKAAQCQDPIDRLVWVAAFGISGYCGSERFYTNFNPLLGETFEFIDSQNGMKFIAEQVSHHPPITASHAHNANFIFWQDTRVKTKFLGNSIEINTNAKTHVQLPKTSDHFYYTCPLTRVHNLLIGSFWLEHYGELSAANKLTNDTCVIQFKKSGFFSRTNYEFEGTVKNAQGVDCVQLSGKWNEKIVAKWLVGTSEHAKDSEEVLFSVNTAEYYDKSKFRLTPFAHRLLRPTELLTAEGQSAAQGDDVREHVLCVTDSRLRPDRRWLQYQQTEHATAWKKTLEERQRHDRRVLAQYVQDTEKGAAKEPYVGTGPVWFAAPADSEGEWSFKGEYWNQREEKERRLAQGAAEQASALMVHESKANKACDFRSYQHANNNAPLPPAPHLHDTAANNTNAH